MMGGFAALPPPPARMRPSRATLASLLFLAGCGAAQDPPARPHVVLVTDDTLRADHLSGAGYPRPTTPHLDAFARVATRFDQAITVIPKTGPSFTTLFTGLHPQVHGVRFNWTKIPDEVPMLAEELRKAGYRTAAFLSNPVLRPGFGYNRGFQRFELFIDTTENEGPPVRNPSLHFVRGSSVTALNEAFLEWARAHDWDEPTFVWIHYMDPHGPYAPPPEIEALFVDDELAQAEGRVPLEKELAPGESPNKLLDALPEYQRRADGEDRVAKFVARYDGEIRFVDEAFGQVVELLRERGLWDPSAVIFTADHGESLGEHGLWFCHGWFANDATLRVPLLIKRPGQTEGGSVGEQVTNLDVAPTILALAGIPLDRPWAGTDVLGELGDRGPVVVENSDHYPEKIYGVRTTRWKYLIERLSGREELYDLVADPHERENLAASRPELATRLREQCRAALVEMARARTFAPEAGVDDPAIIKALRDIGY